MTRIAPRVALSLDRKSFTLKTGAWQETVPVDSLDSKLELYRGLRDRKGCKYAEFYAPTVEKLERLKKRLET